MSASLIDQDFLSDAMIIDHNSELINVSNIDLSDNIQSKRVGPTKRRLQKYRRAWEYFPEFAYWLKGHENVYKAQCLLCKKILIADLTVIRSHATSQKHIILEREYTKAKKALQMLHPSSVVQEKNTLSEALREAVGYLAIGESGYSGTETSLPVQREGEPQFTESGSNSATEVQLTTPSPTSQMTRSQSNNTNMTHQPEAHQLSATKAFVTKPAPPWRATAIVNGHVTRLDLSDYKGRYLILFFYPQDFSKLCASEVNILSDRITEFRAIHTEIVACSVDSHLSHLAWSKTPRSEGGIGNPKIPIIADPTHAIAKDYGVLLPEKGYSLRAHFIIDSRGILRHMSINDIGVGRGTDELLRVVKALQYIDETEEVCPADWKPVDE